MSDVRVQAPVTIQEVIGKRTYYATLPNGKRLLAFVDPDDELGEFQVGDEAWVLLSLCSFNEGRIVPKDLAGVSVPNPVIPGDLQENAA